MTDVCEVAACWGHEVLPMVPHRHVVDLDVQWRDFDFIRAVHGSAEAYQPELPGAA